MNFPATSQQLHRCPGFPRNGPSSHSGFPRPQALQTRSFRPPVVDSAPPVPSPPPPPAPLDLTPPPPPPPPSNSVTQEGLSRTTQPDMGSSDDNWERCSACDMSFQSLKSYNFHCRGMAHMLRAQSSSSSTRDPENLDRRQAVTAQHRPTRRGLIPELDDPPDFGRNQQKTSDSGSRPLRGTSSRGGGENRRRPSLLDDICAAQPPETHNMLPDRSARGAKTSRGGRGRTCPQPTFNQRVAVPSKIHQNIYIEAAKTMQIVKVDEENKLNICRICHANCHNVVMIQQHLSGVKHAKAVEKLLAEDPFTLKNILADPNAFAPHPTDPKPKAIQVPQGSVSRSSLVANRNQKKYAGSVASAEMSRITTDVNRVVDKPLLGLDHVVEYVHHNASGRDADSPLYVCELCAKFFDARSFVPHVVGVTHITFFFKMCNTAIYEEIAALDSKSGRSRVAHAHAQQHEGVHGRGTVRQRAGRLWIPSESHGKGADDSHGTPDGGNSAHGQNAPNDRNIAYKGRPQAQQSQRSGIDMHLNPAPHVWLKEQGHVVRGSSSQHYDSSQEYGEGYNNMNEDNSNQGYYGEKYSDEDHIGYGQYGEEYASQNYVDDEYNNFNYSSQGHSDVNYASSWNHGNVAHSGTRNSAAGDYADEEGDLSYVDHNSTFEGTDDFVDDGGGVVIYDGSECSSGQAGAVRHSAPEMSRVRQPNVRPTPNRQPNVRPTPNIRHTAFGRHRDDDFTTPPSVLPPPALPSPFISEQIGYDRTLGGAPTSNTMGVIQTSIPRFPVLPGTRSNFLPQESHISSVSPVEGTAEAARARQPANVARSRLLQGPRHQSPSVRHPQSLIGFPPRASVSPLRAGVPPPQSLNASPHQSLNAHPHQSLNAHPHQSLNAHPHQSLNAHPHQSLNVPPPQSLNAPPHQSLNVPPPQSQNVAPPCSSAPVSFEVGKAPVPVQLPKASSAFADLTDSNSEKPAGGDADAEVDNKNQSMPNVQKIKAFTAMLSKMKNNLEKRVHGAPTTSTSNNISVTTSIVTSATTSISSATELAHEPLASSQETLNPTMPTSTLFPIPIAGCTSAPCSSQISGMTTIAGSPAPVAMTGVRPQAPRLFHGSVSDVHMEAERQKFERLAGLQKSPPPQPLQAASSDANLVANTDINLIFDRAKAAIAELARLKGPIPSGSESMDTPESSVSLNLHPEVQTQASVPAKRPKLGYGFATSSSFGLVSQEDPSHSVVSTSSSLYSTNQPYVTKSAPCQSSQPPSVAPMDIERLLKDAIGNDTTASAETTAETDNSSTVNALHQALLKYKMQKFLARK